MNASLHIYLGVYVYINKQKDNQGKDWGTLSELSARSECPWDESGYHTDNQTNSSYHR